MFMVQLRTYLCMYLAQAISLLPQLGIEWDLFRRILLVEDVWLEPAVVSCSVAAVLFPAAPLPPRQVHRGKTGPFQSRIARDRGLLPWELVLGCRKPATLAVSALPVYL